METQSLGVSGLEVSRLSLGCMRLGGCPDQKESTLAVEAALDSGITFFDHADIYNRGGSETRFAQALEDLGVSRSDVILQSKCGIRRGWFDFSKEHILASVDGILERLRTDFLDVLLLHRPDTLMEPSEVAEAFDQLCDSGKVRHFGVSNQNPAQMTLLRNTVRQPLVANQIQFGLGHTALIDHSLNVNMDDDPAIDRGGGLLEYCRLHNITLQPWSPLQKGFFGGVLLGDEEYQELNQVLDRIAQEQNVDASAVAIAWILRHPAGMQPILGSMTPARIRAMSRATEVSLSREQWYELYRAAGNRIP